ncbi:hypothetical protein [Fundidesulfovibrio agrisoli]|uniref:hypothetical protein n=1 Tax=Fundidesulfovibrio agrisoli TaxID=2922717 RepID=UPI001FAD04B8|nr:hypothetical protein [Fundidesulfovibrio agrisoli]
MTRTCVLAALAALLLAAPVQARVVKEMQVTRTGKVATVTEDQVTVYRLMLDNGKMIVIGDREFFGPAGRAALDQAAERKLTVEISGHLLIHNDQPPMFTLPLEKMDVRGLSAQAPSTTQVAAQAPAASAPEQQSGDAAPFKAAKLRFDKSAPLGQALDAYAFFTSRSWQVLSASKAEFKADIDLSSVSQTDSRFIARLKSPNVQDTFKSITFVAQITLHPDGTADCPDPALEAVFLDGAKDRLVLKEPPNYYFDRILKNRKIKLDYFLSKAALNPKYGKGAGSAGPQ